MSGHARRCRKRGIRKRSSACSVRWLRRRRAPSGCWPCARRWHAPRRASKSSRWPTGNRTSSSSSCRPKDSEGCSRLLEAIADAPVRGALTVQITGNGRRKARTARVAIRIAQVTLKPPYRRGEAKALTSLEPIGVNVVAATQNDAPAGSEAISWVLLTNLPVKDLESAAEKIQWYGRRWGIETWHKVLKSGCKVEDCLLETGDRLRRYLTLFSIIGVRLMHVAYLARVQPETPA